MPDFELSFDVPQRSPGPVEQPAFQPAVLYDAVSTGKVVVAAFVDESSVKVNVDRASEFPATSRASTTSVGEFVAPCGQVNVLESYGPPAGVATVDAVCVHPPGEPSAFVRLPPGPEPPTLSVTVFRSWKLPPPVCDAAVPDRRAAQVGGAGRRDAVQREHP